MFKIEKLNLQNTVHNDKSSNELIHEKRKNNVLIGKDYFSHLFSVIESSTSSPGGNQVDGLPPASSTRVILRTASTRLTPFGVHSYYNKHSSNHAKGSNIRLILRTVVADSLNTAYILIITIILRTTPAVMILARHDAHYYNEHHSLSHET